MGSRSVKRTKDGQSLRTPADYTDEMRKESLRQLHQEDRLLMDFAFVCCLLDIGKQTGYALARTGDLPGAIRMKNIWKVRRLDIKKFLYGEE